MHNPMRRTALALAILCASPAYADWVVSYEVEATRPAPDNFQVQAQNPPAFSWSKHRTNPPSYVLEVRKSGTVVYTFTAYRNWYLPSRAFPLGTYSWRVRPSNSTEWSNARTFSITSASTVFQVPENAALRTAVLNKPRTIARQLPANFLRYAQWTSAMKAERGAAYNALLNEAIYKTIRTVRDADWPLSSTGTLTTAQMADIRQRVNATARQLETAALLYRLTLDKRWLTEAIARGDQLAALSPYGPTGYRYHDQATRQVTLSLIKGADMLYYDLDATRRQRWWDQARLRGRDIYNALASAPKSIDQYPFDSHGGTNLGYLALIATLGLGNISEASQWFDYSVRAYINAVYAWSGPEGGYANGTAYAQYTADHALQLWQPLMSATGVNLFQKPWARGFIQYFAHFVPPGSTRHLFGDENETRPDFRMMKGLARRINSPHAAWYARNIPGEEDALTLLQAPYPLPYTQSTPVPPPNGALYPSIGWVAMHSNLADPLRTSVYFKSSPYGAYNHSHGDQNGLILVSGGRQLLTEAGYLDYYGSTLFNAWYRQTKAHNAITYDGGIGQLITGNTANLANNARINAFSTSSTLDFAEGDAKKAYGSALTTARRKVWYLRSQNAVVVQDKLAAPVAHRWEWNLHAAVPIYPQTDGSVRITNVDRSVCIRSLLPNTVTYATRTGPAPKAGTFEAHGAFVTPLRTAAELIMLLDVGCKKPYVKMTETTTSRTFTIGTQAVTVPK